MKKLTNFWVLFLIAGIKKFPKDASAHVNGTPNVAVDFRRNLRKIGNTSGFWKPFNMVTSGFRKLFYDSTSSFLILYTKVELRTPVAYMKISIISKCIIGAVSKLIIKYPSECKIEKIF
jgi:hypothetical protein